jgi:DNA-binding CsgD family transcriptional regulator
MIRFDEGRLLATMIPGATVVALDSDNHILLPDEPAWPLFLRQVGAFLEPDRVDRQGTGGRATAVLTGREREVLELAADRVDNPEIAARLTVSARTVEWHLSNVYRNLDLSGKSARTAAVERLLLDRTGTDRPGRSSASSTPIRTRPASSCRRCSPTVTRSWLSSSGSLRPVSPSTSRRSSRATPASRSGRSRRLSGRCWNWAGTSS